MRNLVVCCDGTWNTPDQRSQGVLTPTNVVRLFNAVAEKDAKGNDQLKYYHPGVGSEGNWWEKLTGGAAGIGLSKNVLSAYRWLAINYRETDRIFLFGFSRGAYTVRSAAGMIAKCGLLKLAGLAEKEGWKRANVAYEKGYRGGKPRSSWGGSWSAWPTTGDKQLKIHFIGVWDTVGALGIPNDMAILNLLDNTKKYAFHNTKLGPTTVHARHAVAIDEMRASFAPTLWTHPPKQDVKQVWFPGVHADVGGGYLEKDLSDGALKWMMDEAKAAGLALNPKMAKQLRPNAQGVLHDSHSGLFELLRTQPRSVPLFVKSESDGDLHPSAIKRHKDPPIEQAPYWSTFKLRKNETKTVPIYAAQPWNYTGIYLEAGTQYEFSAQGEWLDRDIPCGPGGQSDGKFHARELFTLAGTLWGKTEGVFKKVFKNEEADFRGSKRYEDADWFFLLGAVANGGGASSGTAGSHEIIKIGDGCRRSPKKSGYLYCFANDAWGFYGNNRGAVTLTVKRLT